MACLMKRDSISVQEAIEILNNKDYNVISVPPLKPKSFEVYLFKAESEVKKGIIYY